MTLVRVQDESGHSECELEPLQALERAQELEREGYYLVALDAAGVPVTSYEQGGKLAAEVVTLDLIADQTGG